MCSQWVLMCKAFPTVCWRFRKVRKTLTLAWEIRKFKKRGKSPNHISSLLETLPTPTRPQAPRKVFTTAWTPNAVSCVRSPGAPLWAPAPWISSAIWRAGRTEVWGWWCGSMAFPITQVDFAGVTPDKSNTSLPFGSFPRPRLPALPLPLCLPSLSLAALSSRVLEPESHPDAGYSGVSEEVRHSYPDLCIEVPILSFGGRMRRKWTSRARNSFFFLPMTIIKSNMAHGVYIISSLIFAFMCSITDPHL